MRNELPSAELQRTMAAICCSILELERVGLDDRFYELGGDSMSGVQLLLEVKQQLGVDVPPTVIFGSPTIRDLAAHVESALQESAAPQTPAILRHDWSSQETRPCSVAQEMGWLLQQFRPETPLVNRAKSIRLTGQLDAGALQRALEYVVAGHEPLRTIVARRKRVFCQIVREPCDVRLEVSDLGQQAGATPDEAIRRLAVQHFQQRLDVQDGPVARYLLVKRSPNEHLLLCNFHYAAFDAWSLKVWVDELASAYQALLQKRDARLPAVPICYSDYALWQQDWLKSAAYQVQVEYWRSQLSGGIGRLELPTDRPRARPATWRGETIVQSLPRELSRRVKRLAQAENCTLFMLLLSAFKALLARWCGQDEIIVGAPVAGREQAETRGLIGRFTDTIVLRTQLSGNPPFREIVRRVRDVAVRCYAHQSVPLIRLHKELQAPFPPGDSWFDVLFQVTPFPTIAVDTPTLKFEEVYLECGMAPLDISMFVSDDPAGLLCRLEYKTDLFDRRTMRELLRRWGHVLEAVVDNPDTKAAGQP